MRVRLSLLTALSLPLMSVAAGLICGSSARGAEPPRSRYGDDPIHNSILRTVAPGEYGRFRAASAKGANPATADAVLNLIRATHRKLLAFNKVNPDNPRTKDHLNAESAYIFSWGKAIQIWKRADDERVKEKIMIAWNAGLTDTPEVGCQIDGLWEEWHPAFMTDSFTKLFRTTSNKDTMCSFCGIFMDYGQDAEEQLLKEKRATITGQSAADKQNLNNINTALEKIGYWRKGDPSRIGPAAALHPASADKP